MTFSNYLEDAVLNHTFRNIAFARPTTVWVGLCTTQPSDGDNGSTINELFGAGYSRVAVANSVWSAYSAGLVFNSTDLSFPAATANWNTVTHFALLDAASAGNLLAWGALEQAKTVQINDIARFLAGDLEVSLN